MNPTAYQIKNISIFSDLLNKIGEYKFSDKFGKSTLSALICLQDAIMRNQAASVVGGFIKEADERFSRHIGNTNDDLFECMAWEYITAK